jgi:lysophospholipase L1-like esterase
VAAFEVEAGSFQATLRKMPPHFRITTPQEVSLEVGAGAEVEARFGIRPEVASGRIPYKYVLVGDSITAGFSQKPPPEIDYEVYPFDVPLKRRLDEHFGRSAAANRAAPGTKSSCGVSMLPYRLSGEIGLLSCDCKRPDQALGEPEESFYQDREPFGPGAYLLILYGTNDFNDGHGCTHPNVCGNVPFDCRTLEHLERMVQDAKAAGAIPVLGTLPPGYKQHQCVPNWNQRFNANIEAANVEIRALAERHEVLLADYWKAFRSSKAPPIDQLISDIEIWTLGDGRRRCGPGLHPTRAGYDLMAEVAYHTITGQPSPYEDTPLPAAKPLAEALEEYRRFQEQTGFEAEPFPFPGLKLRLSP